RRRVLAGPPVQHCRGVVRVRNVEATQALEYFVSARTVGKHHQVEILVTEIQGETKRIFGKARTQECTVEIVAGDHAVTVDVDPPEVTRPGIGLDHLSLRIAIRIDLRFVLEYAVRDISEEFIVGMAHLDPGYGPHVLEACVTADEINVVCNI